MEASQPLQDWIQQSSEGALQLLEELVNINTYTLNWKGVNSAQSLISGFLRDLDLEVERESLEGAGDLVIARSKVKNKLPFLLVGHVDTVHPPDSHFKRFSLNGEFANGPGVLDMKGGLVVMLWALKALQAQGVLKHIPLTVLITGDEEVASSVSQVVVTREAKKSRAALVFEWGREKDAIITRRKGMAVYDLQVSGIAAHSGNNFTKGANAIVQLAHTVSRIHALTEINRGLTLNVGLVQGGSSVNTVPDFAQACFEMRFESMQDFKSKELEILQLSKDIVIPGTKLSITQTGFLPPMHESKESLDLFHSYKKYGPAAGLFYDTYQGIIGGGSDANFTAHAGIPTIDGLGPYGEFPHSDKEYVVVASLPKKMLNLALFLADQV